jgi:hypothetical protein
MNESSLRWGVSYSALLWALAVCAPGPAVAAPQESVLYSFTGGADGTYPFSELLITKSGALIGTTLQGGDLDGCRGKGCGVVFEMTPPAPGGRQWTQKVLYRFKAGRDGAAPLAGVLMDKIGALYGVTSAGGGGACNSYIPSSPISYRTWIKGSGIGCGTIFKLTPPGVGHSVWSESVLYRFRGKDGRSPAGVPLMDRTGSLYGVTAEGGEGPCGYLEGTSQQYGIQFPTGCGTAFRLTPSAAGGDAWTLTTLHKFQSKPDGAFPDGGMIFAADGSLVGTTRGPSGLNGASTYHSVGHPSYHYGFGTIFKLTPVAPGGDVWTQTMLYAFNPDGGGGSELPGGLLQARGGTLFGTTAVGGTSDGTAFQLSPPVTGEKRWTETILHNFIGANNGYPTAGLIRDPKTTAFYGVTVGTVYALQPPAAGKINWTEAVLHRFGRGEDGQNPLASLAMDRMGNLYGTTVAGGRHQYGTVFKVSP